MSVDLVTSTASLRVRPGKPATAEIWLVFNGTEFPKLHWNDFAIIILEWWSTALLKILNNTSNREMLNFMDGPYSVEIFKNDSDMLKFRAIKGMNRNIEVCVCKSRIMPFVHQLISQSKKILDECNQKKWKSNDGNKLEASIDALTIACNRSTNGNSLLR